jgi:uncharacterized membrane protein
MQAEHVAHEQLYESPRRAESSSRRYSSYRNGNGHRLERRVKALGWFSVGLGLAELLAPSSVARLIGAPDDRRTRSVLTAFGLREISAGLGILMRPQSPTWVWSRVAGDVLDLAMLGKALGSASERERDRAAGAIAAVLGVTFVDVVSAMQLTQQRRRYETVPQIGPKLERGIHVHESITVNRDVAEVYQYWRNLENLPRFMAHLESVSVLNGMSKWRAKAAAGMSVEWQAETIVDRPNESIQWRSLAGSEVPNEGKVEFVKAPGGRGTEIRVELTYAPPAGRVGAAIAKLFGEAPDQQIKSDLRRFKQVIETGEVVHSDASIHRGMHAARPSQKLMERNSSGGSR